MDATQLLKRAEKSSFYLGVTNFLLRRMIPFNAPHGLKIQRVTPNDISVFWPYKRKNLNHIKGLHACGLATLAEFTTGISLLRRLDSKQYRLIMKQIRMEYHYQGKTHALAQLSIEDAWLEEHVIQPVNENGLCNVTCIVDIYDVKKNHLATGHIEWQIKDWKLVKTKL